MLVIRQLTTLKIPVPKWVISEHDFYVYYGEY